MSKEKFGEKQKKERAAKSTNGPSGRQKKCSKLRKEIKKLKKAADEALLEEKSAIKNCTMKN